MQFDSFNYIFIFLPVVFILYFSLKSMLLRNVVITIASFTFYSWGDPWLVLLLFSSAFVDYYIGKGIYHYTSQEDGATSPEHLAHLKKRAKQMLLVSLVFNLGMLSAFKYWDWLMDALQWTSNGKVIVDFKALKHGISVPPGISFYTFQSLSYTIDIYRREFT